jgi:hypothetical protein
MFERWLDYVEATGFGVVTAKFSGADDAKRPTA